MRIALDTNVLVRFLVDESGAKGEATAEDVAQVQAARSLVLGAIHAGTKIWLSHVVLVEMVWVLRFTYKVTRAAVTQHLEALLAAPEILVPDRDQVVEALDLFRNGRADFSDYLVLVSAGHNAALPVFTFDAGALKSKGFWRPVV